MGGGWGEDGCSRGESVTVWEFPAPQLRAVTFTTHLNFHYLPVQLSGTLLKTQPDQLGHLTGCLTEANHLTYLSLS